MSDKERTARPDEDLSTENPPSADPVIEMELLADIVTGPSTVFGELETLRERVAELESSARDNFDRVQASHRRLIELERRLEHSVF